MIELLCEDCKKIVRAAKAKHMRAMRAHQTKKSIVPAAKVAKLPISEKKIASGGWVDAEGFWHSYKLAEQPDPPPPVVQPVIVPATFVSPPAGAPVKRRGR